MIKKLYDWTISLAESRYALWALAVVAFVESSVFPIPPDILMIPMIIATPRRAFLIAGVALVSSVAGGALGYLIGYGLMETVGQPIVDFYHANEAVDEFTTKFNELGFLAVLFAGVTPFPYKIITITSGLTSMNFGGFMLASVIARGLRFFIVAGLLWKFGEPIRDFIEKRLGLVFTAFMILLIGGFVAVTYL